MPVVKPPSFDELVKTYGTPQKAILHLIQAGFSPEQIEWKIGIPYYLIRLYMKGTEPKTGIPFFEIAEFYERLAVLQGKKGKETEIAKFLQASGLALEAKVRLVIGKLSDEVLKIGPGLIERSISRATGSPRREIEELLTDYGEHGEVAYLVTEARAPHLTAREVYETIRMLPQLKGVIERELLVSSLLRMSTPIEAKYVVRLLLEDLKLGYHTTTVVRAAARAYNVPSELVEKACFILGLAEGITLASKGTVKLQRVKMRPGQFIKPQLASLFEPDKVVYPARIEYKLDGSRLQIHRWGTRTLLFSRRGLEKSRTLPEIVEIAQGFHSQNYIIDGEVIPIDNAGNPLPFQSLLQRTVPKELSPEELKEREREVGVTVRVFDILFLNGRELLNLPLSQRRKYLLEVVQPGHLAGGVDCSNEIELMRFYEEALSSGYEGIMVKNVDSPYETGRRTGTWLKLKPERDTIDCTIVKGLYGKGKRAGLYSSFLLAVRDPAEKKLYTIGKVSNLPEEAMNSLRMIIEKNRANEDKEGVFVKPTIVVEATYQEIQETDEYTSGFALRVPKIVRFRIDKSIDEIDSLERLQKLHELQYERYPTRVI